MSVVRPSKPAERGTTFVLALICAGLLSITPLAHAQLGVADPVQEVTQALECFEEAQHVRAAQPDRAKRLFQQAAEGFERVLALGIVNGRLEYSCANAFLQAGDVGRAVLHYRRAERLIPRDPMLEDNLRTARQRCLTHFVPSRGSQLIRSVVFWHYETSLRERALVAIVLYLLTWTLLTLRQFVNSRGISLAALGCAALAVILAGSLAVQHWRDRNVPDGVVTAMDVAAYKGPGTGYQRQFVQPLQPGVEFTLLERRLGWWRIQLLNGLTGWIEQSHAELVPYKAANDMQNL